MHYKKLSLRRARAHMQESGEGGGGHINNQTNVRNGYQRPRAPSVCSVPLFLSIVARDYLKVHETLVTMSTCIRGAFEEHPIRPFHKDDDSPPRLKQG